MPAPCRRPSNRSGARSSTTCLLEDVIRIDQVSARQVRLELRADPVAAGRAASLAARETGCCSFFTFQITFAAGEVSMTVSTEPGHEHVLAALAARAQAKIGVGA